MLFRTLGKCYNLLLSILWYSLNDHDIGGASWRVSILFGDVAVALLNQEHLYNHGDISFAKVQTF
jgi:hypothetical protein